MQGEEKQLTEETTPAPTQSRGTPFDKGEFSAWQLAGELGYTIAIPIVIFALVGRWLDNLYSTSPWILLAGIVISILLSSFLVYRKVSRILK
ncbi:MAG: AtpZ/AtpI family protein [bacterium]|nr:AtpZ/AtpI family protein [bacterium]